MEFRLSQSFSGNSLLCRLTQRALPVSALSVDGVFRHSSGKSPSDGSCFNLSGRGVVIGYLHGVSVCFRLV